MAGGSSVPVPQRLLVAAAVVLLACLVAIAYLIGRDAGRGAAPALGATAPAGAGASGGVVSPGAPVTPVTPAASAAGSAGIDPAGEPGARGSALTAEAPPPQPPAADAPAEADSREAVARYFAEVEAIEARAKTWRDSKTAAEQILQQALGGNTRGLDDLTNGLRDARAQLSAVQAPEACREHLQRSLEAMDEATLLLERMRDNLAAGDLQALAGIAAQAQGMERKAKQVDALATSIKQRFGLAG